MISDIGCNSTSRNKLNSDIVKINHEEREISVYELV